MARKIFKELCGFCHTQVRNFEPFLGSLGEAEGSTSYKWYHFGIGHEVFLDSFFLPFALRQSTTGSVSSLETLSASDPPVVTTALRFVAERWEEAQVVADAWNANEP